MAYKTINVHLPISVAQDMDDRGRLNPSFVRDHLKAHQFSRLNDVPTLELPYRYTCKVDDQLHKALKLKSIVTGLTLQELTGRMFKQHYKIGVSDRGEVPPVERKTEGRDKTTYPAGEQAY